MTEIRFVTREIGSLAKPGWRVKAIAGRPVEKKTKRPESGVGASG